MVDGHSITMDESSAQTFKVVRDPVIFPWPELLRTLPRTDTVVFIPGEHLDSGWCFLVAKIMCLCSGSFVQF